MGDTCQESWPLLGELGQQEGLHVLPAGCRPPPPSCSPRWTLACCPQASSDASPAGRQTHLARPWAPAVHRTRPSRGPLVDPASRGSRSSLCWPDPQVAAPAGAATGLVRGGAGNWTPCPSWGRIWVGRELSWPPPDPHPPSSLSCSPGQFFSALRSLPPFPRPLPLPLEGWDHRMDGEWDLISALRPSAQQRWGPSFLSPIKSSPRFREAAGGTANCPRLGGGPGLTWVGRILVWSQRCPQICFRSPGREDTVSE